MSTKAKVMILAVVLVIIAVLLVLGRRGGTPAGGLKAGFDAEFLTRPDGYPGLCRRYGFRFASDPVQLDPGLMYKACADGAVDVICAFATDGRIAAYSLKVLEDDKAFFPPYYAAPLLRQETLKKHPELEAILNRLSGKLSDQTMQRLNYEVDEKGRKAADVARQFLMAQGLISKEVKPKQSGAAAITVGSKHFTEQEILGEMMSQLIESNSDLKVDRRFNLGGTMIAFNALKAGDLDLYAEYTGTGLVNILKAEVINDPDEAYAVVKKAFAEKYQLVWLKSFGFNNTYTLTMRATHARELGIETISDLVDHVKGEDK